MGRCWDGGGMEVPTLVGAGTVAPSLTPEQERHHFLLRGGGRWEAVDGTNYAGAARERVICVGASR